MADKIVTIDSSVIERLMDSPEAVAAFPFLRTAKKPKSTCGSCHTSPDYEAIKLAIKGLSSSGAKQLKQMLGATKIRFYVPVMHRGRPSAVRYTR